MTAILRSAGAWLRRQFDPPRRPAPPAVVARVGEVISCENGHELYRLLVDIKQGMTARAGQVERIDPAAQEPRPGHAVIKKCPHCEARWMRRRAPTLPNEVHFADGWRFMGVPAMPGAATALPFFNPNAKIIAGGPRLPKAT